MADAGNLFDLSAKVSADTAAAERNLSSTQKKVIGLADEFKRLDKSAPKNLYASLSKDIGLDRLKANLAGVEQKARGLRVLQNELKASERNALRAASAVRQDLQGALSTLSPSLAGVAGAAGPLAAVAAGIIAIGAGAAGVYKLATFAAQLGSEVFDLSQKVNFTAETISGLKVATELSGGEFGDLSTTLGIFDRNLEEAHEQGSEMSRVFKVLKIDINDNEKALRQAFTAIAAMPAGYQQTAVAMKLFGRSGKEILGVIKETGGDIDSFIDRMREMGLVITSEGAKKADQFGDRLTMLRNKLEGITRQIGTELIPIVENAASDVENWLKRNQGELIKTAKEIASVIDWVYRLGKAIAQQSPMVIAIQIVRTIRDFNESQRGVLQPGQRIGGNVGAGIGRGIGGTVGMAPSLPWEQGEFAVAGQWNAPEKTIPRLDFSKGGGRGGGGGGRSQRDVLEGLKTSLIGLNAEFRKFNVELLDSANLTAEAAEKEKLLSNLMSSLSVKTRMTISEMTNVDDAINKAIDSLTAKTPKATKILQDDARALIQKSLAQFKVNEETRIAGDLNRQVTELAKQWRQEVDNTRTGADQYTIAIQQLEKAFAKYGLALDGGTRKELEYAAALQRTLALTRERLVFARSRPRMVEENRPPWIDLGLGSTVGGEPGTTSRPRIATVDEQVLRERLEIFRANMRDLASDVTFTIDSALRRGFESGIGAGVAAFGMGILEMINSAALQALQKKLAQVFIDAFGGAQGTGGGGFLSKLFNFGLSALGGLFGGGKTTLPINPNAPAYFTGFRAAGGPVTAGLPYKVHRDEVIVPTGDGMVYNKAQQAGMGMTVVNNWHISAYGDGAQALLSRQTQSQIERRSARSIQRGALKARAA